MARTDACSSTTSSERSRVASLFLAVALLFVASVRATAQEATADPGATGETTFDVVSAYSWRGMHLSRGAVAQWLVSGAYRGLAASLWSNFDPSEYPRESGQRRQITEADFTVSYERQAPGGTVSGGLVYYSLRGTCDTTELYVGYALDLPLRPSATFYLDPDEGKGGFLVTSLGRSLDLARGVTFDLEVEAGFNFRNLVMGTDADDRPFTAPYYGQASAYASIPLSRALALTGSVGYSVPIGGRASHAIAASSYDGATRRFVFGSLGLTASFPPTP